MSTIRADNFGNRAGTSQIPADTMLQGTAKSWLNMNGTGTIALRDSFNVSSITDNAVGEYTSSFSAALPNANYSGLATCSVGTETAASTVRCAIVRIYSVGSARLTTLNQPNVATDYDVVCCTLHGDPS